MSTNEIERVEKLPMRFFEAIHAEQVDRLGLKLREGLTKEQWTQVMDRLLMLGESIQFIVGDALAYGEDNFGEEFIQQYLAIGKAGQTLDNWKWVAKAIPHEIRVASEEGLTWSHHQLAARAPEKQRAEWLDSAKAGSWTTRAMEEQMAKEGVIKSTRAERAREWGEGEWCDQCSRMVRVKCS